MKSEQMGNQRKHLSIHVQWDFPAAQFLAGSSSALSLYNFLRLLSITEGGWGIKDKLQKLPLMMSARPLGICDAATSQGQVCNNYCDQGSYQQQ
jgi:hypothetical protein